ncbi:MAG: hypothetical protein JW969_00785 [Spirochaetales bacterium]|nr:hypothetical protein [Spirochaetales bacterium]
MIKIILGIILGTIIVIFMAQNLVIVDITFLAWTLAINRGVIVVIVLFSGMFLGWIIKSITGRKTVDK